jgi:hypothetical protein
MRSGWAVPQLVFQMDPRLGYGFGPVSVERPLQMVSDNTLGILLDLLLLVCLEEPERSTKWVGDTGNAPRENSLGEMECPGEKHGTIVVISRVGLGKRESRHQINMWHNSESFFDVAWFWLTAESVPSCYL